MTIHPDLNWVCLTPEEGHYTFGYYDRCAWDADSRRHLALNIPHQDYIPEPGETAMVGYVQRDKPGFVPLVKTWAWNHQQGAMTLWLPQRPGCFIFNDFDGEADTWRPVSRIYDVNAGKVVGQYDRQIYTLSRDGRWGVSLDFGRIPRRGYSYALAPLPKKKISLTIPRRKDSGLSTWSRDNPP